jgi:thiamine-phosphate diphosphorylase/hydroxyethylthiazole kinase
MPIEVVRKLLPSTTVIGMSVSTVEEAIKVQFGRPNKAPAYPLILSQANEAAVDYVGIGAVYHTKSKKLEKDVLGVRGVGAILEALSPDIKAVAIGVLLPISSLSPSPCS